MYVGRGQFVITICVITIYLYYILLYIHTYILTALLNTPEYMSRNIYCDQEYIFRIRAHPEYTQDTLRNACRARPRIHLSWTISSAGMAAGGLGLTASGCVCACAWPHPPAARLALGPPPLTSRLCQNSSPCSHRRATPRRHRLDLLHLCLRLSQTGAGQHATSYLFHRGRQAGPGTAPPTASLLM